MPPGSGGNFRGPMRSLTRDSSVTGQTVPPGTTRRILRFAKKYRAQFALFFSLTIVDALITVANPLIYRGIIDNGILNHEIGLIVDFALLIAGLAIVDAALSVGEGYLSAKIGQSVTYDLRAQVFAHIQNMPLAFFTRTQTGALVSRLNSDVLGAQQALTDILSGVVSNVISVVLVLGAMLYLSWQLTLIALILLPVFILPARWLGRRLQAITRESYDLTAKMNNTMIERFNVSGALLAKLFGRPREEIDAFNDKAARVRDINIEQSLYTRFFFIALMLTAALATAFIYGWGGVRVVVGLLDVGTLVALTAYLVRLYGPLTQLSNINVDYYTALVSFDRVFEVLDLKPMITEKPNAIEIPHYSKHAIQPLILSNSKSMAGQARVEFDHVSFSYPSAEEVSLASLESVAVLTKTAEKEILTDVSFTIEPGQMVALVGPSGAGKTTITQLVARLYDVHSGAVKINGVDVRDATFASLHGMMGVVTQDAHMFHESIRANLLYAKPDATDAEIIAALEAAQILPLVQSLSASSSGSASLSGGLDTMVGDRGYRLSGGEKQRLAIARLLLKSPDIIILDEATAHLDSESEQAIQKAFATALVGRTSLVIAHRLSTIRNADRILVVQNGRIAERGKHDELLARGGLYAELYRTQFKGK